eukprot:CAMPEP_0180756562 /NCGR_PEP_ID=MMETSP1038_2-20121128/34297_1 /TAXON_ID=632150 /ORGANISM="Azadinium spinosum, Strain 3D9" /LENGTH=68 /DNA_ID=CAMNT_0022790553 /DNA_START=40 /DNA_END=243 /DNA_ORIENTATION=-
MYLVGKPLVSEVMRQSELLMNLVSVRTLRPVLNWLLRDHVVQRDGTAKSVHLATKWQSLQLEDHVLPG